MQILVKKMNGDASVVKVDAQSSVTGLVATLRQLEGNPFQSWVVRLILHDTTLLASDEPLAAVGIEDGAEVTVIKQPASRERELERRVLALLNKICPASLETIVQRLAEVELHNATDLGLVIGLILQKALNEPMFHKSYADMALNLATTYPEFPHEREGEKPHSFRRELLNALQKEFESISTTLVLSAEELEKLNSPEDIALEKKRRQDRLLEIMRFVGALFLRGLLAVKVMLRIMGGLLGTESQQDHLPQEHDVESAVELLTSVGHELDRRQDAKPVMSQLMTRLEDLINQMNGEKFVYPARIRFLFQSLYELRLDHWRRRYPKPWHLEGFQEAWKVPVIPGTGGPEQWSKHYVEHCMNSFAEDNDKAALAKEWIGPNPSPRDQRRGVEWLLEVAEQNKQRADAIAEMLSVLVDRKVLLWDMLGAGMKPLLEEVEELKLDSPHIEAFAHNLVARILLVDSFDPVILKALPWTDCKLTNNLLVGALKRVSAFVGVDAASRLVQGSKQLSDALAMASGRPVAGLSAHLKQEGTL